jgi:hypothetical protein
MTSFQRAAELQALLEGVPLPASREELLDYAARQNGGETFRSELEWLPDRAFRSLDEVGAALASVQPAWRDEQRDEPKPESGLPPGGAAYTDPAAKPGAVRKHGPRG